MSLLRTMSWRPLALRGAAALTLGVFAALRPQMDAVTLALAFGGYAVVDGALAVGFAARLRSSRRRWLHLLEGLAGIGAGLTALALSRGETRTLAFLVAAWAIGSGACEIGAAQRLDRAMPGDLLLRSAGILSVAAGLGAALFVRMSVPSFTFLLGSYGLIFGTLLSLLAEKIRRRNTFRSLPPLGHPRHGT